MPPAGFAATTVPVRSVSGATGGKELSTTSIVSFAGGVAEPQADVNSDTPSGPAGWLRPVIGRRWLEPCQVAIIATWSTSRRPSFVTPTVERRGCGGVVITPESMNIPSGVPSFQV